MESLRCLVYSQSPCVQLSEPTEMSFHLKKELTLQILLPCTPSMVRKDGTFSRMTSQLILDLLGLSLSQLLLSSLKLPTMFRRLVCLTGVSMEQMVSRWTLLIGNFPLCSDSSQQERLASLMSTSMTGKMILCQSQLEQLFTKFGLWMNPRSLVELRHILVI